MRTPLADFHTTRGAVFDASSGTALLVSYGDFEAGYEAMEEGCALFDLCERDVLRLTGIDAAKLLQGLTTNDVAALEPLGGLHACFLSRQSKILADARIFALPGGILLDLEPGLGPKVEERLIKYRVGMRVDIGGDRERTLLSLQGPKAPDLIRDLTGVEPAALADFGCAEGTFEGVTVLVCRVPRTGRPGFDVRLEPSSAEAFWLACLGAGAVAAGGDVMDTGRVEAGIPVYGRDLHEGVLFSEADLPGSVSHTKGCYVGQEIVARVKTYGNIKRVRRGLLVDGPAAAGDRILTGGPQAPLLTSARRSPTLKRSAAFAYLSPGLETGMEVAVESSRGAMTAQVVDLPFM